MVVQFAVPVSQAEPWLPVQIFVMRMFRSIWFPPALLTTRAVKPAGMLPTNRELGVKARQRLP